MLDFLFELEHQRHPSHLREQRSRVSALSILGANIATNDQRWRCNWVCTSNKVLSMACYTALITNGDGTSTSMVRGEHCIETVSENDKV